MQNEQSIQDYRAIIRHDNTNVRRSEVFATEAEAVAWTKANLDPTPRASKDMREYARLTRTPLSQVATKEHGQVMGRKEGRKNHTVHVAYIEQD